MENALVINKKAEGITNTSGFKEVLSSLSTVKKHKLWGWFIVPFLLNLVLLSAIYYLAYTFIMPAIYDNITGQGTFFDVLRAVIKPFVIALLGIITVFIYSIAGGIICAPFNDILSERVETKVYGEDFGGGFSLKSMASDMLRILGSIVKLLFLLLLVNLLLLLLNLIPVAGNIAYAVLGFLSTLFFFGFQFFEYPLDRRRFTFGEKLKINLSFLSQNIGVGLAFFVLSLIPIVGFLALNMAAIGATAVFSKTVKPALSRGSKEG